MLNTWVRRIDCSPVEPAGHNFDLSPDGLRLAVVREIEVRRKDTKNTAAYTAKSAGVEVYQLPPLTNQEQSEVKALAITAPADTGAAIDEALARLAASRSGAKSKKKEEVSTIAPAEPSADAVSNSDAVTQEQSSQLGDVPNEKQPGEPRKAPTLYGPDEKPQHK